MLESKRIVDERRAEKRVDVLLSRPSWVDQLLF